VRKQTRDKYCRHIDVVVREIEGLFDGGDDTPDLGVKAPKNPSGGDLGGAKRIETTRGKGRREKN